MRALLWFLTVTILTLESVELPAQQPPFMGVPFTQSMAPLSRQQSAVPVPNPQEPGFRLLPHDSGPTQGLWIQPECWYFHTELLSLRRDRPRTDHFSADQYAAPDNVVLGTENLSFNFEPGTQLTLGRSFLGGSASVEFSYFTLLSDWSSAASYTDENPYGGLESNLTATFFSDAGASSAAFDTFRGAGRQTIDYSSALDNWELNFQKHFRPRLRVSASSLVGLRFIKLDEGFAFVSYNINADEVGEYLIATENNLLGFQMGGNLAYEISSRAAVGIQAKGALFVNFSSQNSQLINSDTASGYDLPINTGDITNGDLASVVEVGFFGRFFVTRRIELRIGYDVMLLSGMTLAPEQFDHTIGLTLARKIDSSGRLLAHGVSAGGIVRW
ncbi:MAG: BBP7 family outer membrane beta-barrel protein [Pirellulales bacterium]|nr:BBP7 family outer membrane beta-barrel protein [Pirellulales bacterium]